MNGAVARRIRREARDAGAQEEYNKNIRSPLLIRLRKKVKEDLPLLRSLHHSFYNFLKRQYYEKAKMVSAS